MNYEWDENKRKLNWTKHGLDFSLVEGFDWSTAVVIPDKRIDYGENRQIAFGYIGNRLYTLIFTKRLDSTRIISLRKANRREKKYYEKETGMDFSGRLG